MTRPLMEPQPDIADPSKKGPVPPMSNPADPARPQPVETPVPDPDEVRHNTEPGPDLPPERKPFPDRSAASVDEDRWTTDALRQLGSRPRIV